ncbi:Vesicle-associated membrane protein-associated protein [Lachnellula suecica]|uniref:Vesicle-associated membrane protein-associated protein n=1 Tax=Lachnellula suecica TaxID=602035 RepID=A0A8T9BQN9_9HELO|nr:Vesicle-associated membrane protein-associated protein [Lachnellula suecica]
MSVEIDPQELGFHRPFTTEVSQSLKIRNPNTTPVAFKVKTTAPKQYVYTPIWLRICLLRGRTDTASAPTLEESSLERKSRSLAMKQEPPVDAKCRDKFLVQSVAVTADKEFTNNGSIHVDDADKASVQEKKIRVVYLAPHGSAAASTPMKNGVNGVGHGLVRTLTSIRTTNS